VLDLTGKWMATWMTRAQALRTIVGTTDSTPAGADLVLLGGRIVGEAPVGLWIEIDVLHDVSGKQVIETLQDTVRPRLVRWESISNAALFPDKPDDESEVGFRPR